MWPLGDAEVVGASKEGDDLFVHAYGLYSERTGAARGGSGLISRHLAVTIRMRLVPIDMVAHVCLEISIKLSVIAPLLLF